MDKHIIIIDDDDDDLEIMTQILIDLKCKSELITFTNPRNFLNFIRTSDKHFSFILCDINMNSMDGLELKKLMHNDETLRMKCIPFLFWSTSSALPTIKKAYSYNVQGYFVKPNSIPELKKMMATIINYWNYSEHPNSR